MRAADALVLASHTPAGGLASAGCGSDDDGDYPSPPKPSHAVDETDPVFPEEDEEEEEDDDGDHESTSPGTAAKDRPQPHEAGEGPRKNCSVCNKMFRSIKALHGHMPSHPQRNLLGTVPQNQKGVESEVADYLLLLSEQEPEKRKRRFICSSCNREFPTRQAVGGQRASHKGQKGCYEKAKEAREYGPRIARKRPLSEAEAAGEINEPAAAAAMAVHHFPTSSSSPPQPREATPYLPPPRPAVAPPAALPATSPTAAAAVAAAVAPPRAQKRVAQGPPEVALRKRRLLDLNVSPVLSSEENSGGNGGGSSTPSGNKIEESNKDSSYEESKPS